MVGRSGDGSAMGERAGAAAPSAVRIMKRAAAAGLGSRSPETA